MKTPEIVDASGRTQHLKYFYRSNNGEILFLHDCIDILVPLAENGLIGTNTLLYFSMSWYVSQYHASLYDKALKSAQKIIGSGFILNNNVILLANSLEEYDSLMKAVDSQVSVLNCNNTCFIDTDLFNLKTTEKKWNCVFNAKPFAFKRLELSRNVPNKVFVTYNTGETNAGNARRVDLNAFGDSTIFSNILPNQVADILCQSLVGGILSEEEGACYASTEYLLCGLPVVSTPSRGGRAEFYDEKTAIVCEPDPDAVAQAVQDAISKLKSNEFNPAEIRKRTLDRINAYRSNLMDSLEINARRLDLQLDVRGYFSERLEGNGKLSTHRNFFLKGMA